MRHERLQSDGIFNVQCIDIIGDVKETLSFIFQVIDGKELGKTVQDRVFFTHSNPYYVKICANKLEKIIAATGIELPTIEDIHKAKFRINVSKTTGKDDKIYYNVQRYEAYHE